MERRNIESFALCGNAGSGKDLAFTIMKFLLAWDSGKIRRQVSGPELLIYKNDTGWLLNFLNLRADRFAGPIKSCIAGFLNVNIEALNADEFKQQELPSAYFTSTKPRITVREAHQIIGDALKEAFNIDIFALSMIDRIRTSSGTPTAVLDLRYPNEAAVLRANNLKIIKIVKDNQGELMQHSSEQYINDINADFVLHNDGISIRNFASNVLRMMQEFGWVSDNLSVTNIIRDNF